MCWGCCYNVLRMSYWGRCATTYSKRYPKSTLLRAYNVRARWCVSWEESVEGDGNTTPVMSLFCSRSTELWLLSRSCLFCVASEIGSSYSVAQHVLTEMSMSAILECPWDSLKHDNGWLLYDIPLSLTSVNLGFSVDLVLLLVSILLVVLFAILLLLLAAPFLWRIISVSLFLLQTHEVTPSGNPLLLACSLKRIFSVNYCLWFLILDLFAILEDSKFQKVYP